MFVSYERQDEISRGRTVHVVLDSRTWRLSDPNLFGTVGNVDVLQKPGSPIPGQLIFSKSDENLQSGCNHDCPRVKLPGFILKYRISKYKIPVSKYNSTY